MVDPGVCVAILDGLRPGMSDCGRKDRAAAPTGSNVWRAKQKNGYGDVETIAVGTDERNLLLSRASRKQAVQLEKRTFSSVALFG